MFAIKSVEKSKFDLKNGILKKAITLWLFKKPEMICANCSGKCKIRLTTCIVFEMKIIRWSKLNETLFWNPVTTWAQHCSTLFKKSLHPHHDHWDIGGDFEMCAQIFSDFQTFNSNDQIFSDFFHFVAQPALFSCDHRYKTLFTFFFLVFD